MKTLSRATFFLVFILANLVIWPCWAKSDALFDKKSNATFGEIQIGFGDRVALSELPTPLSIRLKNPYKEKTEFKVLLRSEGRFNSQDVVKTILVDANSEKLIRANLRIHRSLFLEITVGSTVVFTEKYDCDSTENSSRRMLVVYGEDAKVTFPDANSGGTFFLTNISSDNLPFNTACLCAFDMILVQGTDPNTWTAEQRQALDLYTRMGGCVVFSHIQEKDLGVLEYWKSLKDEEATRSGYLSGSLQVDWRIKRHGAGTVLLSSKDLIRQFILKRKNKLDNALSLLARSVGAPKRPYFPLHYTENNKESGSHFSEWLMVIFFVCYIIVLGPIVAIAYRRSTRLKLAKAVVVVVIGFIVLSPALGITIRNASAVVRVFSVIEVDARGDALQSSEYLMISGGGKNYDIDIKGSKNIVGFVPTPDANWNQRRYRFIRFGYNNSRQTLPVSSYEFASNLDGTLSLKDLPISPWERYSFYTMDHPQIKPLELSVSPVGRKDTFVVKLKNNTGKVLERIVFGARVLGAPRHKLLAQRLAPGAEITQTVSLSFSYRERLVDLMSHKYDARWSHWDRVPNYHESWIAAKVIGASFPIEGSRVSESKHRLVWIQGCDIEGVDRLASMKDPDAYLGISIEDLSNDRYSGNSPLILSVIRNSPADNYGVKAAWRLVTFQGKRIRSQRQLTSLLRASRPGQRVTLELTRFSNPITKNVTLGKRKTREQ
ncbi:MAG: PDZ domain-containing protein [Planctomycetota bacterium]|nr:PDZ domain-containing protein [Planctomycetota bacterium]